jgi:hypothetical protein
MNKKLMLLLAGTLMAGTAGCSKASSPCSDRKVIDTVVSLLKNSSLAFQFFEPTPELIYSSDISDNDNNKVRTCVAKLKFIANPGRVDKLTKDIAESSGVATIEEAARNENDKDQLVDSFYLLDMDSQIKLLDNLKAGRVLYVVSYVRKSRYVKEKMPPVKTPPTRESQEVAAQPPRAPLGVQVEFTAAPTNDTFYITIRQHGPVDLP